MLNEVVCASVPNLPVHIGFSNFSLVGAKCAIHYHDEIELLKIEKGIMSCTAGGETYLLSAGDVAFVNSRVPHYTTIVQDGTASVLVQINTEAFFDTGLGSYLSNFIRMSEHQFVQFPYHTEGAKELSKHIARIKEEYVGRQNAYEFYIKANIYSVLAFLRRSGALIDVDSQYDSKALERVSPVLYYINEHYQEPVTLEQAGSILNLNPSYFCRLFKKATNSTLMEYLNYTRIQMAERLLTTTQNSVMEIALNTGFSSVSYFNRMFRRFKNCSPTVYRKVKYAQN